MNVGIVGLGFMGKIHLKNYLALGCNVKISDTNPGARQIAEENNCDFFPDYKEFLGTVDGVSVCVPTLMHFEIAKECLKNTNVLVEKPITATLEEARKLVRLATENKRILMVGHIERYNPAVIPVAHDSQSGQHKAQECATGIS